MRSVVRVIDSVTEWTGRTICWLCVVLILVITFEVTMRYMFDAPTMWAHETSMMLGLTIYVFAYSYALKYGAHVRVDVFYTHLSPRRKAIIDVLGHIFLFLPLIILLIYISIDWMWCAWTKHEIMIFTAWFPPAAPWRTVFMIGLIVFVLQGGAQLTRDLYLLARNKPYD